MRDDGFYWVLLNDEWQVARFKKYPYINSCIWFLTGSDEEFSDSDFEEIGDRVWREPKVEKSITIECKVCGRPFGDKLSLYEHYDEKHNHGDE